MDKNQFVKFLKVMPPFYGLATPHFLNEIKKRKSVQQELLKEFDSLLRQKKDKASWFKYLASMPVDSKNSSGHYRLIEYYKAFPHVKLDLETLKLALQVKESHFIIQLFLNIPKTDNAEIQKIIGESICEKRLERKLFQNASEKRKNYLQTCLKLYLKGSKKLPVPIKKKAAKKELKLLEGPIDEKPSKKKKVPFSQISNSQTKNTRSSSKTPFCKETDELWETIEERCHNYEYEIAPKVLSKFGDIFAINHNHNLIQVQRKENKEYFHANFVSLFASDFIIAQYPSTKAVGTFLRAVIQKNCPCVVDLTYQGELNGDLKYNDFGIIDDLQIKIVSKLNTSRAGFFVSELECIDLLSKKPQKHTFYHLHFNQWKPHDVINVKKLLQMVEQLDKKISEKNLKFPLVIQSHKGVGRSAVFACAFSVYKEIKLKNIKDKKTALKCLAHTFWTLRVQRGPLCIENYNQANLLVRFVMHLIKKGES